MDLGDIRGTWFAVIARSGAGQVARCGLGMTGCTRDGNTMGRTPLTFILLLADGRTWQRQRQGLRQLPSDHPPERPSETTLRNGQRGICHTKSAVYRIHKAISSSELAVLLSRKFIRCINLNSLASLHVVTCRIRLLSISAIGMPCTNSKSSEQYCQAFLIQ